MVAENKKGQIARENGNRPFFCGWDKEVRVRSMCCKGSGAVYTWLDGSQRI